MAKCKECNKEVKQSEGKKIKLFCSDSCRQKNWQKEKKSKKQMKCIPIEEWNDVEARVNKLTAIENFDSGLLPNVHKVEFFVDEQGNKTPVTKELIQWFFDGVNSNNPCQSFIDDSGINTMSDSSKNFKKPLPPKSTELPKEEKGMKLDKFKKIIAETTPETKLMVSDMLDKLDNSSILFQIKTIEAEKIPADRNTSLGRKSWNIEQINRIKELKNKLK